MLGTVARWAAALLALGSGCASQPPSPFFGDERFLVLGVDPDAETDAVARQLEQSGFAVVRQLRGQHFSALAAADGSGVPVKVRIVTARGIALALDPVPLNPLQTGVRYELLPPPQSETHDADGDGFEEVFIASVPDHSAEACILVYRIRDSGFVDRVTGGYALPPGPPPWQSPVFCDLAEGAAPPGEAHPEPGAAEESSAPDARPSDPDLVSPRSPR